MKKIKIKNQNLYNLLLNIFNHLENEEDFILKMNKEINKYNQIVVGKYDLKDTLISIFYFPLPKDIDAETELNHIMIELLNNEDLMATETKTDILFYIKDKKLLEVE